MVIVLSQMVLLSTGFCSPIMGRNLGAAAGQVDRNGVATTFRKHFSIAFRINWERWL